MMLIDNVTLSDIYEFMETGNMQNAPEYIHQYVEMLDKIYKMTNRIDKFGSKEMVIKHLVAFEGMNRPKAASMYNESLEYFYNDKEVSKKAWRNFYAEIIQKSINFSLLNMKDASDAKKIVDMAKVAAEMRGAFDAEIEEIPEELFRTPFIVYSCDAEMLGMPKVDRVKLGKQIDAYAELTEKEKTQIKREAGVLPIKIFPHEQENPRKA